MRFVVETCQDEDTYLVSYTLGNMPLLMAYSYYLTPMTVTVTLASWGCL